LIGNFLIFLLCLNFWLFFFLDVLERVIDLSLFNLSFVLNIILWLLNLNYFNALTHLDLSLLHFDLSLFLLSFNLFLLGKLGGLFCLLCLFYVSFLLFCFFDGGYLFTMIETLRECVVD